jgi:thiamine-phosphate pyrophosphorylase
VTHPETFSVYLITDRKQVRAEALVPAVTAALAAGVRAVQLREKDVSDRELLALGVVLRQRTRQVGAKLLINDRADVAVAVEADGVHLTRTSYSVCAARRLVGKSGIIGVSTHSAAEVREAEAAGADFVTLGPIYETPSKRRYGPALGVGPLREAVQSVRIPVLAIGGIKLPEAAAVLRAGAAGVALISGILAAPDVKAAAAGFVSRCTAAPLENL